MALSPELAAELTHCEGELQRLYDAKAIPENEYHMGLVSLAFEYLAADHDNKATVLLGTCNPVYFKVQQLIDMKDHPRYRDVVVGIGKLLLVKGLTSAYPELRPTQAPGQA
jgi:hypothetical protein